jgi:2-iminobutanoate/2-iminopropanoate deaminase
MATQKEVVLTQNAPQPIGPYSQAIIAKGAGDLVFCSGVIPLDPVSGEVVGSGDVQAQAKRVLESLTAVLEAAGTSLEKAVKTTIFLKSMGDFPKVNEVYGQFFKGATPARSTVEVARLPKDVLVEIECIALKG